MFLQWTYPVSTPQSARKNDSALTPAVDVLDDGEAYELFVELPGVSQDKLTLKLESDSLVVRGERSGHDSEGRVLHNGRYAAKVLEKRFSIGQDIDRAKVTAKLEHGLLRIALPRKAEELSRKIEVEVK